MFVSERGGPMTPNSFGNLFARLGVRAGMPFAIHPHMLRHSCGYALANAGHDTRAIQAWMGHKNIQHTVRYAELAPERFKDFWRWVWWKSTRRITFSENGPSTQCAITGAAVFFTISNNGILSSAGIPDQSQKVFHAFNSRRLFASWPNFFVECLVFLDLTKNGMGSIPLRSQIARMASMYPAPVSTNASTSQRNDAWTAFPTAINSSWVNTSFICLSHEQHCLLLGRLRHTHCSPKNLPKLPKSS
jgi:hypothetical protein